MKAQRDGEEAEYPQNDRPGCSTELEANGLELDRAIRNLEKRNNTKRRYCGHRCSDQCGIMGVCKVDKLILRSGLTPDGLYYHESKEVRGQNTRTCDAHACDPSTQQRFGGDRFVSLRRL